jgi:hypothetical protein
MLSCTAVKERITGPRSGPVAFGGERPSQRYRGLSVGGFHIRPPRVLFDVDARAPSRRAGLLVPSLRRTIVAWAWRLAPSQVCSPKLITRWSSLGWVGVGTACRLGSPEPGSRVDSQGGDDVSPQISHFDPELVSRQGGWCAVAVAAGLRSGGSLWCRCRAGGSWVAERGAAGWRDLWRTRRCTGPAGRLA